MSKVFESIEHGLWQAVARQREKRRGVRLHPPSSAKRIHKPPHPGEVLQDTVLAEGRISVTEFARALGISRVALSRIVNGRASVSADMALRLAAALGGSAESWLTMQAAHDLWQASRRRAPKVQRLEFAAWRERAEPMKRIILHDDFMRERLANARFAAGYLQAALEEDEPSVLLVALRRVAEARGGMAKLARNRIDARGASPNAKSGSARNRGTTVRPVGAAPASPAGSSAAAGALGG